VVQKLSDVNYEITPDGGQGPTKIVHYNQIKQVEGSARAPRDEVPDKIPANEAKEAELQPRRWNRRTNAQSGWARTPETRTCLFCFVLNPFLA
jgi:hypothetical protein